MWCGRAAQHFVHADDFILVILLILFNALRECFLLDTFIKSAIALIIKFKTDDSSDITNNRPITLVISTHRII